jgi:transcriptional regulator with XRE-family HTH domain
VRKADPSWWSSGSFEGRPIRQVLVERDAGAIFRFLKARGWSRAAIAGATGLTETRVRAVSQGSQRITSYEVLERIAERLEIDRGLMGLGFASVTGAGPAVSERTSTVSWSPGLPETGLAAVRAALDTADMPPDGQVRPLSELSAAVELSVGLRLASNYGRLYAVLPELLNELHRAYIVWKGQRRAAVAALLVQAYRAADALADKSGNYDLSARIIGMMVQAAHQSGDELVLATASYVRGELFFANGRPDIGRALLERAAERLIPGLDSDTSAAYGSLHMRAAVLAGQAGQVGCARDHLAEAAKTAALVPDGEYHGTAFGPASVRIHEVTLAVDIDDPDNALRTARDWDPPDGIPGERRSHFYIDLARAQTQLDAADKAVTALFQARAVAPEHTRHHPQVHRIVNHLYKQGATGDQIREYARWAAIPLGVS